MHYYDIHGILTIETDAPILNDAFHRYFKVPAVESPDITVRAGKRLAHFDTAELKQVDNWFYGCEDCDSVFYHDDLPDGAEWLQVHGLQGEHTELYYHTTDLPVTPGSRGSISDLIECIVDWRLIREGYTTLHAASLSKDGGAVLLGGYPNVGKTLSTLALLQDGWDYMGDDNGVIGRDGTVYAYPSTSSIGYEDFLKYVDPGDIGRARYYKHLARVWPMQNQLVEKLFDYPEVYLPDIGFSQGDTAPARAAVVLQRGERGVDPLGPLELADKLLSSTDYSRPRYTQHPVMQTWAYFNPGAMVTHQEAERRIVRQFLGDVDCYSATCQYRDWGDLLQSEVL